MPLPDGVTGICDHCGTVANWFTKWDPIETLGCPCWCHRDPDELWPDWVASKKKRKGKR